MSTVLLLSVDSVDMTPLSTPPCTEALGDVPPPLRGLGHGDAPGAVVVQQRHPQVADDASSCNM